MRRPYSRNGHIPQFINRVGRVVAVDVQLDGRDDVLHLVRVALVPLRLDLLRDRRVDGNDDGPVPPLANVVEHPQPLRRRLRHEREIDPTQVPALGKRLRLR